MQSFEFRDNRLRKYLLEKGYYKDMTGGGIDWYPSPGSRYLPLFFEGLLIFKYSLEDFKKIEHRLPIVE